MGSYILKRLAYTIPMLILIAFVCFVAIDLPPGDFTSLYIQQLTERAGMPALEARAMADWLKARYGLDEPFMVRFGVWFRGLLVGDLGYSLRYNRPISDLVGERMGWTLLVGVLAMLFSILVGVPIGVFSAVKRYSLPDYLLTAFSFIGLSTPSFVAALVMVWLLMSQGWQNVTGLFSPDMVLQPWSEAKLIDLLKHLWIPVLVIGTSGLASNIRIMRANLLDVLNAPYVQTARAKGVPENVVIYKHAVRNALHPLVMSIGTSLPWIIEGTVTVGIVLSLPLVGPMFLQALSNQDMYLAGAILLFLAVLTLGGNLVADIVLALLDPRIRFD